VDLGFFPDLKKECEYEIIVRLKPGMEHSRRGKRMLAQPTSTRVDADSKQTLTKSIETLLAARREILFAYLFGSFIEDGHFRDIDVGIYVDETDDTVTDIFYEVDLSSQVEEIVKFPVDIVILNHAPAAIVYNASKGVLLKNDDDDTRVDFVTLNWKKYWEFKRILRYHMEERKHGSQQR
jgi:predicted nucleotidyltransferase